MFKIAVVVFRECLEIAILLGVIMAATKPIKNSIIYIILGTIVGVVSAALFAISINSIAMSFDGLGDEIFNSSIILITAAIISWTVVWMQGYTKKIRKNLGKLSDKIATGIVSQLMLVAVVASAIVREGIEIILFIYSLTTAEHITGNHYILGLSVGSILGFTTGVVIYKGLINYTGKYIFNISTVLLVLIAAGLSAEAAGILTSSGIVEAYSTELWDTSLYLSNQSIAGNILNVLIGYDSRPNGLQIIFYFATIAITFAMIKMQSALRKRKHV